MSYLKIDQNKIVEAPYKVSRNGYTIYGYNKENNEGMLFEDGYAKFPYEAFKYEIKNGQIVEKEAQEEVEKNIFTKLQIRRALRQLEMEEALDNLLESNAIFKKDWEDAQEIDFNDYMIKNAIKAGLITNEMIEKIREVLG